MKSTRRSMRRWKSSRKLASRRKKIAECRTWWKDYSDGMDKPKPWKPTTFEIKNPSCFTVKNDSWNEDNTPQRRREIMESHLAFREFNKTTDRT